MFNDPLTSAKQISASQRLMLAQIHLGDDVEPRNGAVRQALEEKGLVKQTTGWESMKLTDEGQAVAQVVALASLETISPNVRATLLSVANNRYDPEDRYRHHLSAASLAVNDPKAKTSTLTALGRSAAAILMMGGDAPADAQPDEEPAPAAESAPIDEEPTPILPAPATPPVDTDHLLTQAEELMLFQVLYERPIRPRTPATRDTLVQLGLITVRSEMMWEFTLTPSGEAAAQRLELLDFVPISDRSRLWRVLQGERVHEREMTDTPSHLKLATYDETDGDNLGIASLTESGKHHAGRVVEYVAKKLMYNYPNRVQTLTKIYRSQEVSAHAHVSVNYLNDWGLVEGDTLTDFGRAVAAALEIMEAGYALADLTPPTPIALPAEVETLHAELSEEFGQDIQLIDWPGNLASPQEIAQRINDSGITVEEAASGAEGFERFTETSSEEDAAPASIEESQPEPEDDAPAPDPVEEEDTAPTDDDRAALLEQIETLRAALVEANEALASEWLKAQDPKLISRKITPLHKNTQMVLRGQSEAASKRAEKAEADNAALRAQLKAIKQAAPATGEPASDEETAILRAHLADALKERQTLQAQLDEANLTSTRNARELFQTKRQLDDALAANKRQADQHDTTQRRAERAEADLAKLQQTAQRWQAEHAAAIAEAERLNAIVEQLTAEIPTGHLIISAATPAHLDRLAAEGRQIMHMQFMTDGKLYVVAGPRTHPQPQPDKPAAADHVDAFSNMVYDHPTEETEIIDEDDAPAPEPELEPVYVFSESEPRFNNSLVGILGKNTDEGGLHRAIAVAREFVRHGLWDGFTNRLVILDPYHVHDRLVFGLKPVRPADLVEGTHYQFVAADPQLLDHTTPDHAKQMVEMMRAGMPADQITAELNKANQAAAIADFTKRQAASFSNPPASRSAPPPRRALISGQ